MCWSARSSRMRITWSNLVAYKFNDVMMAPLGPRLCWDMTCCYIIRSSLLCIPSNHNNMDRTSIPPHTHTRPPKKTKTKIPEQTSLVSGIRFERPIGIPPLSATLVGPYLVIYCISNINGWTVRNVQSGWI